jgi:hypothetical protein
MSQELQKAAPQEVQPIEESVNLLAVIARAAADPSVDVAKMEALLSMHERLGKARAEVEFKAAMSRIQPRIPRVTMDGQIIVKGSLRSIYAKYEDIDFVLRPLLAEEGFSTSFDTVSADRSITIILEVSHSAGHTQKRQLTLPIDNSEYRSGPQNVSSSVSFGKRILLKNFFNIITVGEDKDGVQDGGCITPEQIMTIETLVRDTGAPLGKFLEYIGASSIDAIPATHYDRAVSALQRKAAKR